MLQNISCGINTVQGLSGSMDMSIPCVYATISSLREKDAVRLNKGTVIPERHTYLNLLMAMLHDYTSASENLSGNGMDLLAELLDPKSVKELSAALGTDRRTVTARINKMKQNGLVYKEGGKYGINDIFWPEVRKMAAEYDTYRRTIDLRVPSDSRVYFTSKDYAVFSNDRKIDYQRTAFSVYGDHGVPVYANTYYYCTLSEAPTLSEIMEHSMQIISADRDKRLRMIALIFYKKYIYKFNDIMHPMKKEMDLVLKTNNGTVSGWLPLKEMQTRAEMYGVNLCDN